MASKLLRDFWGAKPREKTMIPCSLTLFRENKEKGCVEKVTVYGQGETPPRIGQRFCMLTNHEKPEQVMTGVINQIHWSGRKLDFCDAYPRAIFQTSNSTYRWDLLEGEDAKKT